MSLKNRAAREAGSVRYLKLPRVRRVSALPDVKYARRTPSEKLDRPFKRCEFHLFNGLLGKSRFVIAVENRSQTR